jgi:hypothetical protein
MCTGVYYVGRSGILSILSMQHQHQSLSIEHIKTGRLYVYDYPYYKNFNYEHINIVQTTVSTLLYFMAAVSLILYILISYITDYCIGIVYSSVLMSSLKTVIQYYRQNM